MPISFANIPANIKVPLYWVEVDPSMAGLPSINLKALMVGVMTSDGDAVVDVPIPIGSQAQADQHFGAGSELSRMFQAFYSNNFANEVWALPLKEPTGGVAATGKILITQPPSNAGTIHLYIAGTHIPINVMSTDTAGDIATAIADAIKPRIRRMERRLFPSLLQLQAQLGKSISRRPSLGSTETRLQSL